MPKLAPTTSFATSDYRGLHAFALVDADGGQHWGRYTWDPEDGIEYLTDEQLDKADRDYLQEEIRERLGSGVARFTLDSPSPSEGDPLDDPTEEWEGEREVVRAGRARGDRGRRGSGDADSPLVFDPMRLTDGIEPSDDKILAARPKAYNVSIERRCAV